MSMKNKFFHIWLSFVFDNPMEYLTAVFGEDLAKIPEDIKKRINLLETIVESDESFQVPSAMICIILTNVF